MNHNIILNVDSYKTSHFLQYPAGTSHVSSYIESRGGKFSHSIFFGLQMFLKEYLCQPVRAEQIAEAGAIIQAHGLPFNAKGWQHILNKHGGYLPLHIEALPEGSRVGVHNALVQVVNTDPECAWLTSYVETALLRAVWYPTTVATISNRARRIIGEYLHSTADNSATLDFKLHDFGARGASSETTAALGGCAHLVNFMGTDTISGLLAARKYYGAEMAGFAIPAAEHSTITCWGKAAEADAYANMLKQFAGAGKTVAVVSDSYDLWNAIDNIWGQRLKAEVENSGGTLVIRPDSGDPVTVVQGVIEHLMAVFGFKVNSLGYKVLPDFVRVIQGDGVGLDSIGTILANLKHHKISADNIAFGMGGALLQQVNRDTMDFAMKASAAKVDGNWRDVFKDPITDSAKRSKKGRLAVVANAGAYTTIKLADLGSNDNQLQTVFKNGELVNEQSFAQIRARVRN